MSTAATINESYRTRGSTTGANSNDKLKPVRSGGELERIITKDKGG